MMKNINPGAMLSLPKNVNAILNGTVDSHATGTVISNPGHSRVSLTKIQCRAVRLPDNGDLDYSSISFGLVCHTAIA